MPKISGTRAKTVSAAKPKAKASAKAKTETPKPKAKTTGWAPASNTGGSESGRGSSYTPSPPSYSSGGGE